MEDKYNDEGKYNLPLLKKKSSRRKKLQKLDKEFDLEKYKDRIFKELGQKELVKHHNDDLPENESVENLLMEYEIKFKKYVQEEMSYNILVFINRIIMDSKSSILVLNVVTNDIRTKHPLHKILLNVVKTVLLNEMELVYFSIYLDKLGWESQGFNLEDNLLLTALAVKMYLNESYKFIIEYLNRTKHNYFDRLNRWLDSKKDYNVLSISPRDINTRFNQLIKPSNPFCKSNFIDFNFVVDQILQMSIPYNDTKVHNSNHHTELSGVSFRNDFYSVKPNNIQSGGFSNSQTSMFHKYTPSAFLNQPRNLSQSQNDNPLSVIREENQILYNNPAKKDEKISGFDNSNYSGVGANVEMMRNRSGLFGRQESDNLMVFMRDYSALNFHNENISREPSNNVFPDENFFKNKSQSNVFQNMIIQNKNDEAEKSAPSQEKQDLDKQNPAQLKLSLPVNSDSSNLYNKYKTIKNSNNSFDSSFKDG